MTRSKKAIKKATPVVIDPYLPANGNFGYRVSRYELDLEYKVAINRLSGSATITAVTLASLRTFTLDLSDALSVTKVSVNGRRPAQFRSSAGKLHIALPNSLPAGAAMTIVVRYGGTPRPIRSLWGEVGFEELSEGVLVAGQPNGAASWFPCDDHPSAKASYRIRISTESPYCAIANGELVSRRARAGMTTWTYEQAEPTSTYLVTLQIGMYDRHRLAKNGVAMHAVLPDRLRRNFDHDFDRQPQMMKLFVKLFGPYPLATGYTVVVTDDDLEIPLEAQGISIFGANHCDGQAQRRTADRARAGAPVVRQLGHRETLAPHLAARGLRLLRRMAVVRARGRATAPTSGPAHYYQRLKHSPQDLLLADPGPRDMFDDRVYKRGALTLHVLRQHHRRREFLCAAAGLDDALPARHRRHRRLHRLGGQLRARVAAAAVGRLAVLHGRPAAVTDAGTGTGPITRASVTRVGTATVAVRAVRLRGAVPGRPRSRTGGLLGVRRVLGRVRAGRPAPRSACCRRRRARCARRGYTEVIAGPRTHPMRVAAMVGVVAAAVIAASAPLWSAPRVRRVAMVERGAAVRRAGRFLPARHAARHAGRGEPVEPVRVADGDRCRHAGGGCGGDVRGGLGVGRIPVGHRRGFDGVADPA